MPSPNNNREAIIAAAMEIFSQKGFSETSISEIARNVGIADSVIYHYFVNKEDLLFNILAKKMDEIITQAKFSLQGISDPIARLGKLAWYQLYIMDENSSGEKNIRNLLFECRSNKQFYNHQAYEKISEYSQLMVDILRQGVKKGVFRRDLNTTVARDVILGMLDEQVFYCLRRKDGGQALSDFDEIVSVIMPMLLPEQDEMPGSKGAKIDERIFQAAEELFAEKGFKATRMSEVANLANVSEGTIYAHNNSKEGLLFNLTSARLRAFKQRMLETINPRDPGVKFRLLMHNYMQIHVENLKFIKMFFRDVKLNPHFYLPEYYDPDSWPTSVFESVFVDGRKEGFFRAEISNRMFKQLVVGAINHLSTRWFVVPGSKAVDKMHETKLMVDMVLRAIVKRPE